MDIQGLAHTSVQAITKSYSKKKKNIENKSSNVHGTVLMKKKHKSLALCCQVCQKKIRFCAHAIFYLNLESNENK